MKRRAAFSCPISAAPVSAAPRNRPKAYRVKPHWIAAGSVAGLAGGSVFCEIRLEFFKKLTRKKGDETGLP
jgi:hypothetical protein